MSELKKKKWIKLPVDTNLNHKVKIKQQSRRNSNKLTTKGTSQNY